MNIFVINLASATERREFQQRQLTQLGLEFEFINATTINDIDEKTYQKHYYDWQRPLQKAEVACYFSHRYAWKKVIQSNEPALILEDDALLSRSTPKLLAELADSKDTDLINLENRSRKKIIAKTGKKITCDSKLFRLYQDRTGAAGYILWPQGAKKLIQHEQQKGIALADAHIATCYSIRAYQVEPSPVIQLDQCEHYGIQNSVNNIAKNSTISSNYRLKGSWFFRIKRIYFQLKLGLRQLVLIAKVERRYIKIRKNDFVWLKKP